MTAAELQAAVAAAPELQQCAESWRPEVRLIGNVRADTIALICRALLHVAYENERMRRVYEAAGRYTDTARELQAFAKRGATSLAAMSEHDRAHRDIMNAIDDARAKGG